MREFADLGESTFPASTRGEAGRFMALFEVEAAYGPRARLAGVWAVLFSLSLSSMSVLVRISGVFLGE